VLHLVAEDVAQPHLAVCARHDFSAAPQGLVDEGLVDLLRRRQVASGLPEKPAASIRFFTLIVEAQAGTVRSQPRGHEREVWVEDVEGQAPARPR
jgi:hypothetical protein